MQVSTRAVSIRSIVVKERVRRELGDLTPLMESLRKHGQMNPVLLNRRHELIAGHRRLESARRLGWANINAIVLDMIDDVNELEMELEENVYRKDLSPTELLEGYNRLEKLRKPGVFKRIARFFKRLWGRLLNRKRSRDAVDRLPSGSDGPDSSASYGV